MRLAMVDAVNGELGRLFAGQADITLYGIANQRSAGKTGTAQLGGEQAPHSWFIGFAPAQDGATPEIAVAVLVESGGSGAVTRRPDRRPRDGRMAAAQRRVLSVVTTTRDPGRHEPIRNVLGYCLTRHRHQRHKRGEIHDVKNVQQPAERVIASVERVIVGKHVEVRMALVALLCRGPHPHRGRPRRRQDDARQGAQPEHRLQLPPHPVHPGPAAVRRHRPLDLQPEDDRSSSSGPGRSWPRSSWPTRSTGRPRRRSRALLECMEERQATIDGVTYPMPSPFLVIATQNPIEYEGTFALPEAQLDRFMLRLRLGYPKAMEEIVILDEQKRRHPHRADVTQVLGLEELREMQAGDQGDLRRPGGGRVHRAPGRRHPRAPRRVPGASPRGSLNLYRAVAGLRGAGRARLRDPRRREAAGGGRPGSPPHREEPGVAARGRPRADRAGRSSPRCPSPRRPPLQRPGERGSPDRSWASSAAISGSSSSSPRSSSPPSAPGSISSSSSST